MITTECRISVSNSCYPLERHATFTAQPRKEDEENYERRRKKSRRESVYRHQFGRTKMTLFFVCFVALLSTNYILLRSNSRQFTVRTNIQLTSSKIQKLISLRRFHCLLSFFARLAFTHKKNVDGEN